MSQYMDGKIPTDRYTPVNPLLDDLTDPDPITSDADDTIEKEWKKKLAKSIEAVWSTSKYVTSYIIIVVGLFIGIVYLIFSLIHALVDSFAAG